MSHYVFDIVFEISFITLNLLLPTPRTLLFPEPVAFKHLPWIDRGANLTAHRVGPLRPLVQQNPLSHAGTFMDEPPRTSDPTVCSTNRTNGVSAISLVLKLYLSFERYTCKYYQMEHQFHSVVQCPGVHDQMPPKESVTSTFVYSFSSSRLV